MAISAEVCIVLLQGIRVMSLVHTSVYQAQICECAKLMHHQICMDHDALPMTKEIVTILTNTATFNYERHILYCLYIFYKWECPMF